MLNVELEKFKELYTQYVEQIVNVHNESKLFSKYAGRESGFALRRALRTMNVLQRALHLASKSAYRENLRMIRAERSEKYAQQRLTAAYKREHPGRPGRKPKVK